MNPITYVRKVKLREIKPLAEGQRARCWESLNVRCPVLTTFLEQRLFYLLQMSARMIPSPIPEFLAFSLSFFLNFLFEVVAQTVKNLPAMLEIWVRSLGRADSLEKGMAIHSSILAWRIPWTEEPGRLQFISSQRVGHD